MFNQSAESKFRAVSFNQRLYHYVCVKVKCMSDEGKKVFQEFRASKNFAKKLNHTAGAALDACTAREQSFIELADEFLRHVRES